MYCWPFLKPVDIVVAMQAIRDCLRKHGAAKDEQKSGVVPATASAAPVDTVPGGLRKPSSHVG